MTRSAFARKLALGAVLLASTSAQLFVFRPVVFAQAPAATIRTFEDKAAFLAATAATSATGPLPDLGVIPITFPNFTAPVTLGSITATGLADGVFYVGAKDTDAAPDWYPGTPAHDMAFSSFQWFQVESATPIHALGFELVEPNATMPPWGATPVDSIYAVVFQPVDNLPVSNKLKAGQAIPVKIQPAGQPRARHLRGGLPQVRPDRLPVHGPG